MKTVKFNKTQCGVELLMNVGNFSDLPDDYFSDEIHNTDFFEILFFKRTKGQIILNQNIIELEDYSVVFISPFQKRQWKVQKDNIEGQFLIFQEDFLNEFFSDKLLIAYKNSDQNSNLLIFHIYKYFFIYLIFNNITFKMYIQNYK